MVDKLENYLLYQTKFGYLEGININREISDGESSEYSVELKLCSSPSMWLKEQLVIQFFGVRNLKLGNIEGLYKLFVEIELIKDHQLENLNYRVVESENNTFSFQCSDFNFTVC